MRTFWTVITYQVRNKDTDILEIRKAVFAYSGINMLNMMEDMTYKLYRGLVEHSEKHWSAFIEPNGHGTRSTYDVYMQEDCPIENGPRTVIYDFRAKPVREPIPEYQPEPERPGFKKLPTVISFGR
jgi:hypothetical protein